MLTSCPRFPLRYPNKSGTDGKSGLGLILYLSNDNISPDGCLKEEVSNIEHCFESVNLRVHILSVPNLEDLHSALELITHPHIPGGKIRHQNIHSSTLRKEDSFCFIGLIAKGDRDFTQFAGGKYILDSDIEKFFNEDYCVILRGKPKLFLYFKNFIDIPDDTKTVDFLPTTPREVYTDEDDWTEQISATSLNFFSFYILDLPRTESSGSPILQDLLLRFKNYEVDCDILSFFTEFLDCMNELPPSSTKLKHKSPSICIIMRNTLRCKLFFSLPQKLGVDEEQDPEVYLSDNLSARCGLNLVHPTLPISVAKSSPAISHNYTQIPWSLGKNHLQSAFRAAPPVQSNFTHSEDKFAHPKECSQFSHYRLNYQEFGSATNLIQFQDKRPNPFRGRSNMDAYSVNYSHVNPPKKKKKLYHQNHYKKKWKNKGSKSDEIPSSQSKSHTIASTEGTI